MITYYDKDGKISGWSDPEFAKQYWDRYNHRVAEVYSLLPEHLAKEICNDRHTMEYFLKVMDKL